MIIDSIEYSDKYELVRLTIEGESFYISYDFFHKYNFTKGDEVDFDLYKDIIEENSYNKAKNYVLKRISYANKTSFELRNILMNKDYDPSIIDRVMDFLDDYHLVDDEAYVRSFIRDKSEINSWPRNKISFKLRAKGIDEELIARALDELIDSDDEYEKALYFAEKKARGDYSFENKNKVYRHLASKGFSYDIISRVIGELF
ncbi:MAG: regulatory protein RecX [Anaerococcus sp.]|nr:regulatory protein RecX [Anaerococcus sp.]